MNPRRGVDRTFAADNAGTIASRNGSATVAPIPRRKVRRSNAFFMTNLISPLLTLRRFRLRRQLCLAHLERSALHDAQDQRCEGVIAARAFSDNRADGRLIEVLHVAAEAEHEQLFSDGGDELLRMTEQRGFQPGHSVELLAVWENA